MEKTSNFISHKVALGLGLDKDNEEVIAYGTFVILHAFISTFLIVTLGILFDSLTLTLIIYFVWSLLRKYTGGAHATTPLNCIILGAVICTSCTLFVKHISTFISFTTIIVLGFIIFSISYFLIYKLSPCESPNKPISDVNKIRMRKNARIFIGICIFVSIISIYLYKFINFKYGFTYTLGIYAGVSFQILTLTKLGHLFINRIDSILNVILENLIRRS